MIRKKLFSLRSTLFSYLKRKGDSSKLHPVDSCQIPTLTSILTYFLGDHKGVFVEVGAFDGISFSNTYHLAASGWRGIYCEPVEEYARKCALVHSKHPLIDVLQVAVSDQDGAILSIATGGVFSTSNKLSLEYFMKQNFSKHHFNGTQQIGVQTMTLDTVIKKYYLKHIDLLVIDVEGHELNVLNGLSISTNRPSVIIIELQEIQHENDKLSQLYAQSRLMLHRNHYICVYSDLVNTIFVDRQLYKSRHYLNSI